MRHQRKQNFYKKFPVRRSSRIQSLLFSRASIITTFIHHYHDTIHMPDARDLFSEANELVEPGRLDEALTLFPALLKTDSNNATLWNNVGIIRF
ncbi:MAG: hypothetical protein NTW33_12075 [Methanoregula sp.]|nr:hypothetical protein [Methanoregula sp.]